MAKPRAVNIPEPADPVGFPGISPGYAMTYVERSGLIAWDRDALASCRLDEELSRILHTVALLEQDTEISARQARSLGIDSARDVGLFLPRWECEEAEHARAIRFLLAHQTYRPPQPRPMAIPLRRRGLAWIPLGAFRRLPQTGLVYCALGAAAEYVTIVTYTELARDTEEPAVVGLLRAIARQEGRHFAFFLAAARARATVMSSANGRLARLALASLWEPVGLPSLGMSAWTVLFGRFLESDDFRARARVMDRVVDLIPHLGGLELMSTFLRERVPGP
jgi:rubrerythrin